MNMTAAEFRANLPKERRNAINTGKPFEKMIELSCAEYERLGIARIKKVDQPIKIIGSEKKMRTIFLVNPFLDYIGCLDGRMVVFEAKSTITGRLPIGGDKGLTKSQITSMQRWHDAGAMAFLLWECNGTVKRYDLDRIKLFQEDGAIGEFEGGWGTTIIHHKTILLDFLYISHEYGVHQYVRDS